MDKTARWNIWIGIAGAIIAALGVLSSVLIYLDGLEKSIAKEQALIDQRSQVEYQRRLWDARRQSYQALAVTLGGVAAEIEVDKNISDESMKELFKAYWGSLILVENDKVRDHMVRLKDDLRDLDKGRISTDKIKRRIERILTASKAHIDEGIDDDGKP